MKVLVTGSEGFIGRNVCSWLRNNSEWELVGLDRLPTPAQLTDDYICLDLSSPDAAESLDLALDGCEAIIHLAADMRQAPHETEVVEANCAGTQRLIEACERSNVKTFVQLSSLPVIGSPKRHPITEQHELCPPTVYHVTKVCEEMLADYAMRCHGIRTVSFRISAPVGPGMKPSTIFPTFIRSALANDDLLIYGQGTRKQTYIHVDDIAQALFKAIQRSSVRGVYNLSSHNLISNLNLATRCVSVLESKSSIKFSEKSDPSDGICWDVSIERIEKDAGYCPQVDINECIVRYADYLRATEK